MTKHWSLLVLLAAGCGSSSGHTLSESDYDHSCDTVADCEPVTVSCCPQTCPATAIRATELPKLMRDIAAACSSSGSCAGGTPAHAPGVPTCQGRLQCVQGTCQIEMPAP